MLVVSGLTVSHLTSSGLNMYDKFVISCIKRMREIEREPHGERTRDRARPE